MQLLHKFRFTLQDYTSNRHKCEQSTKDTRETSLEAFLSENPTTLK